MTEKILCIQLKQIGDVLMTTPAISQLAESFPEAEIHFLTLPPSDLIFKNNSHVATVICYPKQESIRNLFGLIKRLRKEHYSTIIDFHGLPKTAFLSRLTGAQKRIGFEKRGRSFFYTETVTFPEGVWYSALHKAYILKPLNIVPEIRPITFEIGKNDSKAAQEVLHTLNVNPQKPLISISPVSRRDYKVWPAKSFARICDYLVERYNAQILFVWGPGEDHFVSDVRNEMRHSALPNYKVPTISETAALLGSVDLHIGNDNGPMHFAISANTPTIAIFGRPLAKNWTPPDSSKHIAVEYDPGCKNSCFYPKCGLECINQVSIDTVIEKIDLQIQRIEAGKRRNQQQKLN